MWNKLLFVVVEDAIKAFRVHTNTLSVQSKTPRFENALESTSKQKCMHIV